jgi:hypothetical protein
MLPKPKSLASIVCTNISPANKIVNRILFLFSQLKENIHYFNVRCLNYFIGLGNAYG